MNRNRAFTLIELLVVIAIIAILAAILFPVFAQAKAAAKKTQDLSQFKQVGTSVHIYTTDYDDVLPLAYGAGASGATPYWLPGVLIETPADWDNTIPASWVGENQVFWENSTFPYVKNGQMMKSATGINRTIAGKPYDAAGTKPYWTNNIQYNGLLNGYSATAITAPSQLAMFSQNRGTMNIRGMNTSNPYLNTCSTGPCHYIPSSPTCAGAPGAWSEMLYDSSWTQWVHGRGQITVQADSSARWRSMNGGVNQPSDYKTMYWTRFNNKGGSFNEWQDTNFCHTMLFMPDFDFATYGTPIEY